LTQVAPSVAGTFSNEPSLPRVPLPALAESCARFLEWCAPLLNDWEMTETGAAVDAFLRADSPAHRLQAALEQYEQRGGVGSWLDEFWATRYLGRRDRIALNANFFCLLPDTGDDQIARAARLISSAVNYKQRLDAERITPDVDRGRPLSMAQYRYLFSTTRIPGEQRDRVRAPYSEEWPGPSRERHIVVLCHGHLFRFDVIGAGGQRHSLDDLAAGLRAIVSAAHTAGRGQSVGHLTTKARPEWAATRRALLAADAVNGENLDVLERALFCVALETTAPADAHTACDRLLHGDSANRWFDKAISFIVFADGRAGLNGEHSCLDGVTVAHFLDVVLAQPPLRLSNDSGAQTQGAPPMAALEFELTAELRADIAAAGAAFAAQAAATATTALSLAFSGPRAKTLRISPDAFAQMAFQLAHNRSRGFVGATYESIATRQFQHGRIEAMRVVSPDSVRFVALMDDQHVDGVTRRTALRAAASTHVRRAQECQRGEAPEQHLWELQLLQHRGAVAGTTETLALYHSPGWLKLRDDYLSTSATSSEQLVLAGFGPTGPHCIGVSYILGERFDLFLSAPAPITGELQLFAGELLGAVREMDALLSEESEFERHLRLARDGARD
jgi:carnitine O-acetyltransferase